MAACRFSMSLFDFDAATGLLSNYLNLGPSVSASSVSFSPDNSKLYVSHFDVVDQARGLRAILSQFDLAAGDAAAVVASRMSIVAGNPSTNIQAEPQRPEQRPGYGRRAPAAATTGWRWPSVRARCYAAGARRPDCGRGCAPCETAGHWPAWPPS